MPPSIFQQIVLPYLAQRPIATTARFARFFSSNIPRARAPANTDPSSSSTSVTHASSSRRWDYVPPIEPVGYNTGHDPPERGSRAGPGARLRLPIPYTPLPKQGGSGDVMAFLKSLEELKGARKTTLLMALEKIASIPEDLLDREAEEGKVAVKGKTEMGEGRTGMNTGKARRDEDSLNVVEMSQSPNLDVTPSSSAEPPVSPLSPELPVTDPQLHPDKPILSPDFTQYPLVIYSLLRTRLYRLTVYHLLQTPEYAVDQALLDRVAEYLKRGGAGKLASRLEKGWDGTLLPRDSSDAGASEEDRPPTHPIPSESSLRHAPNAWLIPRRAAARPLPPPSSSTLSSLTANYNSHLTRALLSPKKRSSSSTQSDNPLSPLNNLLTTIQPLQRPSGGMRQLRQLLRKIERLEAHRSFRPDWVTANLVVKCWMSCLMAGGQGWRAGSKRKGGEGEEAEIDKRMELRGLFAFVKVLFERRLEEQLALGPTSEGTSDPAIAEEGTSPATAPPSTTATTPALPGPASYPYRHTLSYTKHVRPFANDLLRALRQIGDRDGYHQVIGWQREMRERMEPVYAEWKAGSRSHKGRNGPS